MTNLESKIKQAKHNLPDDYRKKLENFNVTAKVDEIAENHDFNEKETDHLDREVTYLLLDIQGTADFLNRLENKLDLSEDTSLAIVKSVTKKILRPIETSMEKSDEDVPVPPPPPNTSMPDSTSYGGASDPYREPVDS